MWDLIERWWKWNTGACVVDPLGDGDTRPKC